MLLTQRIVSIPYLSRQSNSNTNDLSNSFVSFSTSSLQHFNKRVTERLHRYRSLKRQWQDVATAIQIDASLTPKSRSPTPIRDLTSLTQEQIIKEYITSTTTRKEKTSIDFDPLHFQIEKDLINLRKFIKVREKKHKEHLSSKTNAINRPSRDPISTTNEQEKTNIRKIISLNKLHTLHRVKISGCQMRPLILPETQCMESKIGATSQSSSNSSQPSKEQQQQKKNMKKIMRIYRNRVHHSLPSDAIIQGISPVKKITLLPSKTTLNTSEKPTPADRLPLSSIIKKKQSTFIQPDTSLSPIPQPLIIEPPTTCRYTYAASSSSAIPRSMKLHPDTSLLPIFLTSSSCIGHQPPKSEGKNNISSYLLDYKHLIAHLPKPLVPILPRYDQGEYGLLFKQLDHIRENMPDSNVYENYTRSS